MKKTNLTSKSVLERVFRYQNLEKSGNIFLKKKINLKSNILWYTVSKSGILTRFEEVKEKCRSRRELHFDILNYAVAQIVLEIFKRKLLTRGFFNQKNEKLNILCKN